MNKKQLMMLFSLVFFVSLFAVGIQSGVTTSTATSYQTFEMSLTDPLYSVNTGNSGGSGCTASSTSTSYSSFSLNPSLPTSAGLQASTGFMVFDGFIDEENGTFVPFSRDPSNTSLIFPRDEGGPGQSPRFVDWSGDFQDRPPDWIDVTAVFDIGTQNPLANTTALNHLIEFDQFDRVVIMDGPVPNPLVVAELHWMDCNAIFESDLVVNGFFDENHTFSPIKVNDSVSSFIEFTEADGPPALLFPTENWYDMPQLNMTVTGVWNILDYNMGQTLDENIQNLTTNILQSWIRAPDGRSPEWVELTGLQSNVSDFVVSVKFYFQNDCSCQRWYWVDENHGDPFLTTLIDGKGAVNFTQFDFGFWENNEYNNEGPWKQELKGVYLASEFDPSEPLPDGQSIATNYFDSYDYFENIAYLLMKNATHHLDPGTPVVIVVLQDHCPPPPPCDIDFTDVYASGYYDVNNTFYPFRAQGDKLSIDRELDYFNLLVSKLDNPSGIFNFSQHVFHVDVMGIFVNSTYDFNKLFFDLGNVENNLLAGHGPNGQFSLTSAPGDSVDLLLVFQFWYQYNCVCVPAEAVMAALDFYDENTKQYVLVKATGNIVNLPDASPEPFYFEGMGPNEDRGPDMVEILGVYANSSYNFNLLWHEQASNLYLSYDELFHQITLNSAPGDQEPLIIVMKLNWFCPDTTCDGNLAPVLASHTPNQVIYAPVDSSYVLSIKFEDDNINNHGVWKVWMASVFVEDTWSGNNLIIDIKFSDHFIITDGFEVNVNVDVYDDCDGMNGYDLTVIFTENPPDTTSDDTTTTDDSSSDESSNQTLTTTPGFELFAILLGLPIVGIIARKRN
jgi:hypothetical protein